MRATLNYDVARMIFSTGLRLDLNYVVTVPRGEPATTKIMPPKTVVRAEKTKKPDTLALRSLGR